MSRGAALLKGAIGIACLAVILALVLSLFRSREERLWDFLDERREALVDRREDDVFSGIDTALVYRGGGGLAEMRRDYARWKPSGLGATVLRRDAAFDATGADVVLRVVLHASIRPVAEVTAKLRVEEDERGEWRVTRLSWD